jgi:hypothetical protein
VIHSQRDTESRRRERKPREDEAGGWMIKKESVIRET